jgi:hypothetical protein
MTSSWAEGFGLRRLDAALTLCRKRSQACALQRHLSGFSRRNAGEITSPSFALRSFEPRQRLFRSAAARRRFETGKAAKEKRSQATALQRHLSGFSRRNAGEITSPSFALRSFEPRQRLFRSAAARRRFETGKAAKEKRSQATALQRTACRQSGGSVSSMPHDGYDFV